MASLCKPRISSTASGSLAPVDFSQLAGWPEDDHLEAFLAFRKSAVQLLKETPKKRHPAIDLDCLAAVAHAAIRGSPSSADDARQFFENHFTCQRIAAEGFVTGYYEPELAASPVQTSDFNIPLYRPPPDLVEVRAANRPANWDPDIRFARKASFGIEVYSDRAAIESGALAGTGLELAWLADPIDAYFVHVQGSARLSMPDGSVMRIAYAGKNGHPYKSIGKLAIERGHLSPAEADKAGLEKWLRQYSGARQFMRENRSYIFFRHTPEVSPDAGPIGAAGVSLTAGRSLAVDRTLMTFHTPIWVEAPTLSRRLAENDPTPLRRLMIAQDTGSAILGPARGDIFFGSGAAAGEAAGRVRHAASMTILVPNIVP